MGNAVFPLVFYNFLWGLQNSGFLPELHERCQHRWTAGCGQLISLGLFADFKRIAWYLLSIYIYHYLSIYIYIYVIMINYAFNLKKVDVSWPFFVKADELDSCWHLSSKSYKTWLVIRVPCLNMFELLWGYQACQELIDLIGWRQGIDACVVCRCFEFVGPLGGGFLACKGRSLDLKEVGNEPGFWRSGLSVVCPKSYRVTERSVDWMRQKKVRLDWKLRSRKTSKSHPVSWWTGCIWLRG